MRPNNPNKVILHCTDTPDVERVIVTKQMLYQWHVEDNGWSDIAYHDFINREGILVPCRPLKLQGAHAGYVGNRDSIGICYEGTRQPTNAQLETLFKQYLHYKDLFLIQAENWEPHHKYNPRKTCPNIPMNLLQAYFKERERGNCNNI